MKKIICRALLLIPALSLLVIPAADAQAQKKRLTITPKRLVVDARDRSGELTIMNIYSQAATYRVQFVYYKMKEEGGYEILEQSLDSAFDAEEYVRLTPRQFRLEPQGSQRVRLSVRRPPDLPTGDYRFHIMVTRLTDEPIAETGIEKGINMGIKSSLGVTIPAVIRQGPYNGDIKIEDVQIQEENGRSKAVITVRRLGNNDIFGGVRIFWEPQGGAREQIGSLDNTNVFHELQTRKITTTLHKSPQGPGKLIVQYVEDFYEQGVIDEVILDR